MWTEERVVAERFGVSVKDCLRLRRRLVGDGLWVVEKEKGVVWSDEGVVALAGLLGVPVPEKKDEGPVEVRVVRCDFPNKRVIVGAVEGRPVRVRVREAGMYVPGMVFRARRVAGVLDGEMLEELRAPRGRGRV